MKVIVRTQTNGVLLQGMDEVRNAIDVFVNQRPPGSAGGLAAASESLRQDHGGTAQALFALGATLMESRHNDHLVDTILRDASSATELDREVQIGDWDWGAPRPHLTKTSLYLTRVGRDTYAFRINSVGESDPTSGLALALGKPLNTQGFSCNMLLAVGDKPDLAMQTIFEAARAGGFIPRELKAILSDVQAPKGTWDRYKIALATHPQGYVLNLTAAYYLVENFRVTSEMITGNEGENQTHESYSPYSFRIAPTDPKQKSWVEPAEIAAVNNCAHLFSTNLIAV